MISLIIRFLIVFGIAAAIAVLSDMPGRVHIEWTNIDVEISIAAVVSLLVFLFLVVHSFLWTFYVLGKLPSQTKSFFSNRKIKKGYDAISKGFISIAAGEYSAAKRHLQDSERLLPNEPLTLLLRFQSAQVDGDERVVESSLTEMAANPQTALFGLRGLHTKFIATGEQKFANAIAEQAIEKNPGLDWAARAVMRHKASDGDWDAVIELIRTQLKYGIFDKAAANKLKAIALTAKAQNIGTSNSHYSFQLAMEALKLDPSLVPAAIQLCNAAIKYGKWKKAKRLAYRCFGLAPHVQLAEAYSRLSDVVGPKDRLKNIQELRSKYDGGEEGAVAEAKAALSAREFQYAKETLADYIIAPTKRVASLMSAIADAEGDTGTAREWLARAVVAERDPQWTADGYVSESWLPISPVTGEIGMFEWKVPLSRIGEVSPVPVAPKASPQIETLDPVNTIHLPDDPGIEPFDQKIIGIKR